MTDEPKEEKPKMTPEEEYKLLCDDLSKTLKVLIFKQLQFKLTHEHINILDGTIENDIDYLKSLVEHS